MLLNLLRPAASATESEALLSVEQPPDQVPGVLIHAGQVLAPLQLTGHDLLVEAHEAGVHEGRLAVEHLIHQDAK